MHAACTPLFMVCNGGSDAASAALATDFVRAAPQALPSNWLAPQELTSRISSSDDGEVLALRCDPVREKAMGFSEPLRSNQPPTDLAWTPPAP